MSAGILSIKLETISGCEDDRPVSSPWEGLSQEEVMEQMRRVEQEAFKRNEPDHIVQMRIEIFTIVKHILICNLMIVIL